MQHKLLALATTLLFTSALAAQEIPGYLGKRWIFGYTIDVMPTLFNPNTNDYKTDDDLSYEDALVPISLSITHNLNAEYVLSKKRSVKGNLSYLNTYYGNTLDFENPFFAGNSPDIVDVSPLNVIALKVSSKSYRQHFAPLGPYIEVGLSLQIINYSELEYEFPEFTDNGNVFVGTATDIIEGGTALSAGAHLGWGRNRVIKDKWVIGYGFEVGFLYPSGDNLDIVPAYIFEDTFYDERINLDQATKEDLESAARSSARARATAHTFLNFKFSVGILN